MFNVGPLGGGFQENATRKRGTGLLLHTAAGAPPPLLPARAPPLRRPSPPLLRATVEPLRWREKRGKIEEGDQRDPAAGSGTAAVAGGQQQGWGWEGRRAGWQVPRGVAWGGRGGNRKRKEKTNHFLSLKARRGCWVPCRGGPGGWVNTGWVIKKLCFWQKRSPNCDFYGRSTFLSSRSLTGGSGVRGKADPNWVSKIFNILRS
jgi:hypothetical protein